MATQYKDDIIAWANEQAALLRAGKIDALDLEHIADEVEDVGKSEQRELESRMALLLAHLLKWSFQPSFRGRSWEFTIREQRHGIQRRLLRTPSLKAELSDDGFWRDVWADAVYQANKETQIDGFPEICPWTAEQALDLEFLPA